MAALFDALTLHTLCVELDFATRSIERWYISIYGIKANTVCRQFKNDEEATTYVISRAQAGSEYHRKVIAGLMKARIIKIHSPSNKAN